MVYVRRRSLGCNDWGERVTILPNSALGLDPALCGNGASHFHLGETISQNLAATSFTATKTWAAGA